ncbi:hypothetical protein [Rubrolithibacter danxiaensis]|uniref:hypothetical protein n=1 Tax=Rubrolithibacter danxiaensis TaxID=3390805 RepID=UPI003BF8A14F
MKNLASIIGIAAGAAAVTAILYYKRNEVSRVAGNVLDSAKDLGNKLATYGNQIKDKLLHNVHGPHGEPVYLDMYDQQFYENEEGKRVYLES